MLLLVGQDIFCPVDHAAIDLQEQRTPSDGSPAFRGYAGKRPIARRVASD
ncbi:hypothetical protein S1OALGB6SA_2049 [Olavius algarvensis spirochete endosymbiont]|nr:hypothetical protein S1OALGB6SA_2049 [Olavius algarvensis spirochete endosymbiont]